MLHIDEIIESTSEKGASNTLMFEGIFPSDQNEQVL